MSSPRNDLVKNYRVHPTHWLISTQVTGTKFEEPDEKKNPQRRGGHQVKGMKEVDPETAKRMEAVREHQSNCPRLPWADEIRTMAAQPRGFASLSTVSCAERASKASRPGPSSASRRSTTARPSFVFRL